MTRWGLLFPGQGSQYIGMGKAFYEHFDVARDTFKEADEALGYSLSRVILRGTEDDLKDTEVQQPAILVVSIAIWRVVHRLKPDFSPALGLGLSLGEYSAYVVAGAMDFPDAVRVTRIRGRAMQEAVPKGIGGMLAILGMKADAVEDLCRQASQVGLVEPANYNAPGQTVVSGFLTGIDRAEELARQAGARTVRLSVSAPFHSSLLQPAGAVVSKALNDIDIRPARFPVIANVDTELCIQPKEIIPRLIAQVSNPVLFEQSVLKAIEQKIDYFLELGPGRSLTSLVKKIDRRQPVLNVEDTDGLSKALELL